MNELADDTQIKFHKILPTWHASNKDKRTNDYITTETN